MLCRHRELAPHASPTSMGHRIAESLRGVLDGVWANPHASWGVAVAVPAVYGVLAGWWTPRGPLTSPQAMAAMGVGLTVGLVGGLTLGSRWAMVMAPIAFMVAFEIARLGTTGPTVDAIHLNSTYGVMAFAVGRLVHALLTLLPMVLGVAYGAALARRWRTRRPSARLQVGVLHTVGVGLRRTTAGLTALALIVLGVLVARPATTDAIVDAGGHRVPGSVAELTRVDVNGHDLSLMIRGRNTHQPVVLFLAGGPGGTELGAMRKHGQALEDTFVVATLDQRGTGKSYDQLDSGSALTVDSSVQDVIAVTNYLRNRFHQDKVYLLGQSWGTLLGVLTVQREPQLFHAFIGAGQMVSPVETDRIFYRDTLAWARRIGNTELVAQLTANGPPPYSNMLDYEPALSYEQEVYPYEHTGNSEGSGQMGENIFVEEYSLIDQAHVFAGFLDTFAALYPQIQGVDLRTQASTLKVPVFLAQGAHEARGRAQPAREWFKELDAPSKQLVVFETSGHRPLWEQPDEFAEFMTAVLAQTTPS
jgi:proline iminopeptidase